MSARTKKEKRFHNKKTIDLLCKKYYSQNRTEYSKSFLIGIKMTPTDFNACLKDLQEVLQCWRSQEGRRGV